MKITDPLIELLAIKLYEHDAQNGYWPPKPGDAYQSWMSMADEDRQSYRDMAAGKKPIPSN